MSLSPPGKFSPNKHTHWDSRLIELRPSPAPRILKLIKSVLSGDYAKPHFFWDRRVDKRWKTSKRWKKTTRSSVQSKKQAAGGSRMWWAWTRWSHNVKWSNSYSWSSIPMWFMPPSHSDPTSGWWSLVSTNMSPWGLLFPINISGVVLFFSFCNVVVY